MRKNFCARCQLLVERTLVISGNTGNGVLDWAEPGGWAKLFLRLSLLSHCDKYQCSIYCTQSFSGVGLYLNANGLLLIVYDWFLLRGYVELLLVMVPEVLYSLFPISSVCLLRFIFTFSNIIWGVFHHVFSRPILQSRPLGLAVVTNYTSSSSPSLHIPTPAWASHYDLFMRVGRGEGTSWECGFALRVMIF